MFAALWDLQCRTFHHSLQENWTAHEPDSGVGSWIQAVYVGAGYSDNRLYALNAYTGTQLWSYAGDSGYSVNGPSVANGVVYVGSNDHHLYALNASTGAKLWITFIKR